MNRAEKINRIAELCEEIASKNEMYGKDESGFYLNYDRVIDLLEKADLEITETLRCARPKDLPEDLPWSESCNPECGFDPFVFDGTMSPKDFTKAQEMALEDFELNLWPESETKGRK